MKNKIRDIFWLVMFFPTLVVNLLLMPFVGLYQIVTWEWEQTEGLPLFQLVKARVGIGIFLLLLTITVVFFLITVPTALSDTWLNVIRTLLRTLTILTLFLILAAFLPSLILLHKVHNARFADWHRHARKAINANDLPTINKLLANRNVNRAPNIVIRDKDYTLKPSLLYLATRKKNLEIITLLFEHGANPNLFKFGLKQYWDPLWIALLFRPWAVPFWVWGVLTQFWDPLWVAMRPGNELVLDCFLAHGVDVNRITWSNNRPTSGTTPLIEAVERQNPALVKKLLRAGANPNYYYDGRNCPLSIAILLNNMTIIQLLLDGGADPNLTHRFVTHSPTPLYIATELGHETAVSLLLAHGADPNTGIPAIIAAIEKNYPSIIDQLLPLTRFDGTAAYEIISHTIRTQNHSLAEMLLAQNPSLKHPFTLRTESLVYLAVQQNNPPLLELLLEHGAEPNLLYESTKKIHGLGIPTQLRERKSPLALALETNHATCRQILLEYVDLTAVAYEREVWENGERVEQNQQTGQQLVDSLP